MSLDQTALQSLRPHFSGTLVTPDHAEYNEARRVWNAMIDRRPAAHRPLRRAPPTWSRAVNFARDTALPLAVRGGGHSVAGNGVVRRRHRDRLRRDERHAGRSGAAHRAAEAGAARWAEFDRETQAFGLATTGGTVGDTGIAGLTLGGGFGWLGGTSRHDRRQPARAPTSCSPNGQRVHASATEHPDLFWAIRGGGGNFGIVTAFEYRLHPSARSSSAAW